MQPADMVIHSARYMATMAGYTDRPARGAEMSGPAVVQDGALAVISGRIAAVGRTAEIRNGGWLGPRTRLVDASGKLVTPGFVDPHTHMLYAGSRENELALKLAGVPYLEILKQGGGILATVRSTSQASDAEIKAQTVSRLNTALSQGTTTLEIKSGYGLSTEQELRALRLIKELQQEHVLDLVPTFLGAHAVPPGFREAEFTDSVLEEMLPAVARSGLAEFCDVFCEPGVFGLISAEKILRRAGCLGLKLKIHADELAPSGGAELASSLRVHSAEHLLQTSDRGIRELAQSGVIAVLLPSTSFNLGSQAYARAGAMLDAGVPLALATDSNPGSSPTESIPLVLTLACVCLRLTPEQALTAVTINAAHAVGRAGSLGSLEAGKQADVLILDVPNISYLGYRFGYNPVETVIKRGKVVYRQQNPQILTLESMEEGKARESD